MTFRSLVSTTALCGVAYCLAASGPARAQLVINLPAGGDVVGAVNQVAAAGGGTVNLAAGTYMLTQSIPMFSNITLNGAGSSTVIMAPATPHAFPIIYNVAEGIGNIVISNLVLDGNIPRGAFLPGQGNPYNGAGIYLFAYTYTIQPVTLNNVEVRNTSIGLLFGTTNNITITHSYIHGNNPGGFAHNAYFVNCSGVNIDHSRFDASLTGDGLHFDFGSSVYNITKSEFSNNQGEGVLDQGGSNISITQTAFNGNANDGLNTGSQSANFSQLIANDNNGFGYNNGGGSGGAFNLVAYGDLQGFGQFFGDGFGNLLGAPNPQPNVYPAILANGPVGPADTADWTTAYPGTSTIGAVDFNAHHLTDGELTFPAVGAVGSGPYSVTLRYSNGTTGTLKLRGWVNGAAVADIAFPPTGGWSNWGTTTATLNLLDGGNTITLKPFHNAAPELDYLQVDTGVPSPPAAPTTVSAAADGAYAITINWNKVAGAASYYILRDGSQPVATAATGTSFTDTNIQFGATTHSYTVQAQNQGGTGAPSQPVTATSAIDTPAGFQATVGSGGNVLNWISANGAASYTIWRASSATGKLAAIASVPNTTSPMSSNFEQYYTDATAVPGYTYSYAVSAVNAAGESAQSYRVPAGSPGSVQASMDIGTIGVPGVTDYNAATGTYGLSASGLGLGGTADGFRYAYIPISGNVVMTARVILLQDVAPTAEAGIDLRSDLTPGAVHALVAITAGQGAEAVTRNAEGGASEMSGQRANVAPTYWIRLERKGKIVTTSTSPDGVTWTKLAAVKVKLASTAYIGFAVSSTSNSQTTIGLFDTVTVQSGAKVLRLARK